MKFALLLASIPVLAAETNPGIDFFETRVRPIFATQCAGCHGVGKVRSGGLSLATPAGIRQGGDSGPILSKEKPEESRLLEAVSYQGRIKMPPTGKLQERQLADLREWVKLGAPMPEGPPLPPVPVSKAKEYTKAQKEFWSFRPIKDYPPPSVPDEAWVRQPLDRFILAKLAEKKLAPAPPASKLALLRRVTFDLTGLPPTPQEVDAFLQDNSTEAYPKLIERLLASPRYGERWGRHWLDVARYADSTGADEDHRYPFAWRYRDYVIEAFNRDLPYNQFVEEQIAGDLLPAKDAGVNVRGIVGTGFLSIGPRLIAEQDKKKMVYDFIDEQIDVTSKAFLGLTVACARCHDHKFDPIATKDYYALASIFASTKAFSKIEGTVSQMYYAPLVSAAEYEVYKKHQAAVNETQKAINRLIQSETDRYVDGLRPHLAAYMMAAATGRMADGLKPEIVEKWRKYLDRTKDEKPQLSAWYKAQDSERERVARQYQAEFDAAFAEWQAIEKNAGDPRDTKEIKSRFYTDVTGKEGPFALDEKHREEFFSAEAKTQMGALKAELDSRKKASPPEPPMAVAVAEGAPVQQHVFIRGDAGSPGDPVSKRFPVILAGYTEPQLKTTSGRLELARWIADAKNPLTARVIVNRVWQWHFGEGLVRTPSNWGLVGERPTHPELLDYLATRFIESGWSIKALNRMIMLSSTYQMSSEITKEKADADPGNRLLSHFGRRRLDVEELRDGMLQIDGSLDYTMGGTLQTGTGTDGENDENRKSISPSSSKRRTVYLPLRRSNLPTLLNLFDFGDATTSGDGRAQTNVAPQALFMMNSAFVKERAAEIARQIAKTDAGDRRKRVEQAYMKILARRPAPDEVDAALAYVDRARGIDAWQSLCHILLASNEFVYVD